MKLLAVTFAYNPNNEEFRANILKYLPYVEHLIIWDNTPDPDLLAGLGFDAAVSDKIQVMGIGKNVGIAYAANRAVEQAVKEGYTHILTMDQDSEWEDFYAFRQSVESSNEPSAAIFAPRLDMNGHLRKDYPDNCYTSGMLIPLSIFTAVGMFREDYFIDAVDTEFCYRCREAGYSIKYIQAILHHSLGHKTVSHGKYVTYNYSPFRLFYITRNNLYLWKDYRHTDIGISFWKANRILYYYAKHILIGEHDRLKKLSAMARGYLAGIAYKPSRK